MASTHAVAGNSEFWSSVWATDVWKMKPVGDPGRLFEGVS
jgi:hypothetical protein